MISFLILVMVQLVPCLYFFFQDVKEDNFKHLFKWVATTILLMIALFLKSINL